MQWHAENAKNNSKIIHASERCAAGIIQAIAHFNLGPNISLRDVKDFLDSKLETKSIGYEVVKFYLFYEKWRRAEVEESCLDHLKKSFVCLALHSLVSHSGPWFAYLDLEVIRSRGKRKPLQLLCTCSFNSIYLAVKTILNPSYLSFYFFWQ